MRPFRLLAVVLSIPLSLTAQSRFDESLTVNYVEVPVTVVGRDGAPVRGLTKANFEVIEEGQRREIESFDAIDFAAAGDSAPPRVSLNPAARRNFLLVFDLSYARPGSIGRAQKAARDFVARSVGDRDRVGIATIDAERGFRFLTAFTTDRNALTAAIADPYGFRAFDPLLIAGSPIEATLPESPEVSAAGRGSDAAADLAADFARMERQREEAMQRGRVKRQVETLAAAARSLQRLAGRKHLVLLSEGFDARLVQGRSVADTREQNAENLALQFGEIWKVDSEARFGSATAQTSMTIMAEQFRRADVVMHAIDIQGVRVRNDARGGANANSNEGLFLLANATGGTVFQNSNDIAVDLDRFSRQHEVVYVLGFRAPAGKPGSFREVRVRTVGVSGGRVQHRSGYYATGNDSSLERSLSAAEVILNDIPQDAIGLGMLAAAFPAGEKALVPVILEISGADLVRHGGAGDAAVQIFVYAFDADGIVRGSLYERVRLEMGKAGKVLSAAGIRFYGTLRLPPGHYDVKALVSAGEGDKKGFRNAKLQVPRPGDVSIVQPLFFAEPGEWVMVKAVSDGTATPYPFVVDGEPFIPSVQPKLRRGEPRRFAVFVHNADPDELTWQITPESELVSSADGDGVARYVFAVRAPASGARELVVTVRRKDSADARTVTIPIDVR